MSPVLPYDAVPADGAAPPASDRRWIRPAAAAVAGVTAAVWLALEAPPLLALLPAGVAGFAVARLVETLPRRGRRGSASPAAPPEGAAVDGFRRLDDRMLAQLSRAVTLSETSSIRMIERVTSLRALSARLMDYLASAHTQSNQMQAEIERNGAIIGELAHFVQQLPQQIAHERRYLDELIGRVRGLSSIAETIRSMARQTEILSINAAIAAAHAGESGRAFGVLAGEVRRLALQSKDSAHEIEVHINELVDTVQKRTGGEFAARLEHNESEAARLLELTGRLDEGYLDMRQFYALLLAAITEHNGALDSGITGLLDTAQYQDVFKQIVDRLAPAMQARNDVLSSLLARLRDGARDTRALDARAAGLADVYDTGEASHRDPEADADAQPGDPGLRIELF